MEICNLGAKTETSSHCLNIMAHFLHDPNQYISTQMRLLLIKDFLRCPSLHKTLQNLMIPSIRIFDQSI